MRIIYLAQDRADILSAVKGITKWMSHHAPTWTLHIRFDVDLEVPRAARGVMQRSAMYDSLRKLQFGVGGMAFLLIVGSEALLPTAMLDAAVVVSFMRLFFSLRRDGSLWLRTCW